jgi:hypothetical protein
VGPDRSQRHAGGQAEPPHRKRPFHEIFGSLEGQVWMADDWDSQEANRRAYGDAWEGIEPGPSESALTKR